MRFAEVASTSEAVAATSSRTAKRDALAALLRRAVPGEVPAVVGFLTGEVRQGRVGVGWRTLASALDAVGPAPVVASLEVTEVDEAFSALVPLAGPGSAGARRRILTDLLERATGAERTLIGALVGGGLRQGALAGVMADAVAAAAGVRAADVRRAGMLGGRLDTVAVAALSGGADALARIGLEVGRPLQPMLASTAESVTAAVEGLGDASVEWKLDGIRIQVHRDGDVVRVWSRNLNDITEQVPAVVQAVAGMSVRSVVLDGEALAVGPDGRPAAFQDTASGRALMPDVDAGGGGAVDAPDGPRRLRPWFFDVLHVDGRDLVDEPLAVRRDELVRVVGDFVVPAARTSVAASGEAFLAEALAHGHEGVVVKAVTAPYEAGRRGKAWRKVKPVHTLDLVVLGVEWGHGRRRGLLSNVHLGARNDEHAIERGGPPFVMVGKTFKGMTDELLRWQTVRFGELEVDPAVAASESDDPDLAPVDGPGVVAVRPVQVVEVAVDGVQRSTRYASGVALRFARVLRYRDDKGPEDADTIHTVRSLG